MSVLAAIRERIVSLPLTKGIKRELELNDELTRQILDEARADERRLNGKP